MEKKCGTSCNCPRMKKELQNIIYANNLLNELELGWIKKENLTATQFLDVVKFLEEKNAIEQKKKERQEFFKNKGFNKAKK